MYKLVENLYGGETRELTARGALRLSSIAMMA